MQVIEHTYNRLLVDIGGRYELPSLRGSRDLGIDWCVNDAPKLEKLLLSYIEHDTPLLERQWPTTLWPLVKRFMVYHEPYLLRDLRQLLLFCYKAEYAHTDEQTKKAQKSWIEANESCKACPPIEGRLATLLTMAKTHCTATLARASWKEIVPHHGPGAVYDKSRNKGKWSKWFTPIDSIFPYSEYLYMPGSEHWLSNELTCAIEDMIPCRLVCVPKDSRGPRLICIHPAEAIWIQQGVRGQLEAAINRRGSPRWIWPEGHIHFDDQTVNGQLALKASSDGSYATIDLKEASDRMSVWLVRYLFGEHYRYFDCCRATHTQLPDGSLVENHCYAPMGNATTFPVQSLVFWSLCVSALELSGFHQPGDAFVFGDDIIVPTQSCSSVMEALELCGLVVNREKSFYKGAFRESCGIDAYKGVDVTPVRWKTTYDAVGLQGLQSMSSIAQRLRERGYHEASTELYFLLRCRLKSMGLRLYCTNNPDHGGIAEFVESSTAAWNDAFWHRHIQWYCSRVLRLADGSISHPHGWNHVLASLSSLKRTGRSNDPATTSSRGYRLNRGWTQVL